MYRKTFVLLRQNNVHSSYRLYATMSPLSWGTLITTCQADGQYLCTGVRFHRARPANVCGRRSDFMKYNPYPEPVVFQWQSNGIPVCLELGPQCTLECHWRNASVLPVVFQWFSSGFPVVIQCVPIMQINTGSPLGHHWVLTSASVVPVASQCTCGSSGLPVCSNYAN